MSTLFLVRVFFGLFAIILFFFSATSDSLRLINAIGLIAFAVGSDFLIKRINLRSLTTATVGLFLGYLLGKALVFLFSGFLDAASFPVEPGVVASIKTMLFFIGSYLGVVMTLRSSDEFHLSIPFVRFTSFSQKKKDLIADASILIDARVIDLASSGLIDQQLVVPRFLLKEFALQVESSDETVRNRAKRALEVVKKLEQIPPLQMRINESDFSEIKDTTNKLVQMARMLEGMILTADFTRVQMSALEDVRVINIHNLSNALKPLTQAGQKIRIKIQRVGKESRQGVGYLEDGTMIVVNGGGEFVGETIDALVLSVKHTISGRMIFCNALEEQASHCSLYQKAIRSNSSCERSLVEEEPYSLQEGDCQNVVR